MYVVHVACMCVCMCLLCACAVGDLVFLRWLIRVFVCVKLWFVRVCFPLHPGRLYVCMYVVVCVLLWVCMYVDLRFIVVVVSCVK